MKCIISVLRGLKIASLPSIHINTSEIQRERGHEGYISGMMYILKRRCPSTDP